MIWARLARALAMLIAVFGAIDPALTLTRPIKPTVSIVSESAGRDDALAERVSRLLAGDYTVVRGSLAGASAIVAVGDRVPAAEVGEAQPAIAVLPRIGSPRVTIGAVDVASRASIDARVPVTAAIRARGARGRKVEIVLHATGIVVDRQTRDVVTDDERFVVTLGFLPTEVGAVPLQVNARVLAGDVAGNTARADALVDVQRRIWRVLFVDRRPSWASTFVRRALEDDTRFVVASRVETSRAVSSATAGAPPNLSDPRALVSFDAVVVGAPDALTDADVSTLSTFARDRAGAIILLMERRAAGPYDRLIGVSTWREATRPSPEVALATRAAMGRIEVSELAWPAPLPPGATALALVEPFVTGATSGPSANGQPVVWAAPLGQGRVVVSGVLDAWRFRASAKSSFDRFWRGVIGDAADASPAPLEVRLETPVIAPEGRTRVHITIRDAVSGSPVAVSAEITSGVISTSSGTNSRGYFRVWPDGELGSFTGVLPAPPTAGPYRVAVSTGTLSGSAPLVVMPGAVTPADDDRPLIEAWAAAHGGVAVDESKVTDIVAALGGVIHAGSAPERTHPMRSVWWMVPFAAALGVEWTLRRRNGAA